jgi:phospholipase C
MVDGTEFNLDTKGKNAPVKPQAAYQGQLDPDPDHHFEGVDLQLFPTWRQTGWRPWADS